MIDMRQAPLMLGSALAGAGLVTMLTPVDKPPQPAVQTEVVQDHAPSSPAQLNVGAITNSAILRRESDGHYWALASIGRSHVKFMVDTGASTVALTYEDARRLGLDPDNLDFRWTISTAGGETKGASVLLPSIRIGRVEVENVEAMVLGEELEQSLLGMTFLSELYSYEFRQNSLIIRQ